MGASKRCGGVRTLSSSISETSCLLVRPSPNPRQHTPSDDGQTASRQACTSILVSAPAWSLRATPHSKIFQVLMFEEALCFRQNLKRGLPGTFESKVRGTFLSKVAGNLYQRCLSTFAKKRQIRHKRRGPTTGHPSRRERYWERPELKNGDGDGDEMELFLSYRRQHTPVGL